MHIERDVITKFLRSKKLIVYGGFDLCFLEYLDDNVITVTKKLQNKDHMATEVMTVKRNTTFTWDNDSSLYYHNVYIFEDVYQIMSYLSLIELGLVPPLVKNNIMLSLNGMSFDALKVKNDIVQWIKDWFEINGKGCKGVLGISGGKDSSVVAALLVEALGKENVVGVLMPKGEQFDIDVSIALCEFLDIEYYTININDAYNGLMNELLKSGVEINTQATTNLPPRLRMATVYAVSQSVNGRVANTCNLSEDWVGYSTRYGDSVGDFSPLSKLTVQEVKEIGRVLGLPDALVDKVPIDGLQGKTDEDNLGFTYAVLDRYIRTGEIDDPEKKKLIDYKHRINLFKLEKKPILCVFVQIKMPVSTEWGLHC